MVARQEEATSRSFFPETKADERFPFGRLLAFVPLLEMVRHGAAHDTQRVLQEDIRMDVSSALVLAISLLHLCTFLSLVCLLPLLLFGLAVCTTSTLPSLLHLYPLEHLLRFAVWVAAHIVIQRSIFK